MISKLEKFYNNFVLSLLAVEDGALKKKKVRK